MQQNTWLNIESVEQGETTIIDRTDTSQSDIELAGNSSINVGEGNQIGEVSCTSQTSLAGNLSGVGQWKGGCETSTSSTGTLDDLQGTWVTSCTGPDQYGVFRDSSIEVSGTTLIANFTDYSDVCQTPRWRKQSTLTNLSIGEEVTLTNGATGYQFTMNWELQTLTPYDDNAKQVANDNNYCGRMNWEIGVAGDITGIDCGDLGAFPPKGITLYNTYSLTGNNLFTGEHRTDGTYPESVTTDQIHVKQSLTGLITDLQGTWISSCLNDGWVNVLKKIDVSDDSINFEWSYYEETDNQKCINLRDILAFSTENISTTDNSTMTTLSATLKKFTLTPFGETESYNRHIRCGFSDWETGATRDVAGLGIEDCDFHAAGTPFTFQYALDEGSLDFTDFTDLTIDTRTYTKQ